MSWDEQKSGIWQRLVKVHVLIRHPALPANNNLLRRNPLDNLDVHSREQPTWQRQRRFQPNTCRLLPALIHAQSFLPKTALRNPRPPEIPLLVATPPQITRTLAYSHPFIAPLNRLAGLLSWSTGDPWESFLLVASFWAVTLYGDVAVRYAGPVVVGVCLILGMYFRRYSPLSTTGWTNEKKEGGAGAGSLSSSSSSSSSHRRKSSDSRLRDNDGGGIRHGKSLDEIVDVLKQFTARCNILLEPFLRMTDFLSTPRTPTSATTRPALTALSLRILLLSPLWIVLSLAPLSVITTKRVVLMLGTLGLSWHSRPARVSRTILWRSRSVRWLCALTTGLPFDIPGEIYPPLPLRRAGNGNGSADHLNTQSTTSPQKHSPAKIRFTFSVWENQRRWLGIGWTSNLLAYERAPWTDDHLNPSPPKERFELPWIEGATARWRWVEGSRWRVEKVDSSEEKEGAEGWIYYDNKWRDPRPGLDGWGRYTRRRRWFRDAELVEIEGQNHNSDSDDNGNDEADGKQEDEDDGKGESSRTPTPVPVHSKTTPPSRPSFSSVAANSTTQNKANINLSSSSLSSSTAPTPGTSLSATTSPSRSSHQGDSPTTRKRWFNKRPSTSGGTGPNSVVSAAHGGKTVVGAYHGSTASDSSGGSVGSGGLGRGRGGDGGDRDDDHDDHDDVHSPLHYREGPLGRESDWGVGDDARMGLG